MARDPTACSKAEQICPGRAGSVTATIVGKVRAVMWNTYREAVRARILHGMFGLAVASTLYAIIVGQYASKHAARVLSDLGVASLSFYAIVVAVVIGATSLYREIELKTIFPILSRPLSRGQYILGKFLGTLLTLLVFMAANAGILFLCLAALHGDRARGAGSSVVIGLLGLAVLFWRAPSMRTVLPAGFALYIFCVGFFLASSVIDERQVVFVSFLLSSLEVSIVAALAVLFSSFSSPFLTALFTLGVFVVGRSADTLAQLPAKVFGPFIHDLGVAASRVVPNLMVYVPPRSVLTGASVEVETVSYVALAAVQALGWSVGLLVLASLIFKRRDFV